MPTEDQKDHTSQQQQQQQSTQSNTKVSATANANPNSTISNELVNMTQAFKEKKKLVRRAFSMPRNLFRLSRRVKNTTNSATTAKNASSDTNTSIKASNNCNQSVQTISIDEQNKLNLEHTDNNKHRTLPVSSSSSEMSQQQQQQQQYLPEAKPQTEQDNKHRLFRRSTWKKFLFTRFILQSINLKVKLIIFSSVFFSFNLPFANNFCYAFSSQSLT